MILKIRRGSRMVLFGKLAFVSWAMLEHFIMAFLRNGRRAESAKQSQQRRQALSIPEIYQSLSRRRFLCIDHLVSPEYP